VPDTNVLARAARPGSLAARVLAQIITGPHLLPLSPVMLAKVARVLRYPRLLAMHGLNDQSIAAIPSVQDGCEYRCKLLSLLG